MGIKTIKVLRIISKVILAVFVLAFVGYGGLVTYKSIVNRPQRVRITNITDSAATITWVTKNPVRGVVYYNENGFFLPGPLSFVFGKAAYDDRDVSAAQDACVAKFNENAKNTKDANFSVDGSDFNCENAKVEKIGAYYTHSVTVPNLKEETKYSFRVGNGIWSWDYDGVNKNTTENDLPLAMQFNFSTEKTSETVPTPNIAYGTVYAIENVDDQAIVESDSKDSLVFAYLTINGNKTSYISGVTNTDGGWILDKSNFRDTNGDLITDLSNAKLTVCAQYESVPPKVCLEVTEDLDQDTNVDLLGNVVSDLSVGEKNQILKKFDELIGKIYAYNPDTAKYSKCEQSGVDGCNGAASKCSYKCTLIGTTDFDWKIHPTETVGNGGCNLPYSCGCPAVGDCEDKCVSGTAKKRTCGDTGGYRAWTAYSAGVCPGESDPCSSNGGGVKCYDSGTNSTVDEGNTCSNGRKCTSTGCDGGNGDSNDGPCDEPSDAGKCIPGTNNYCSQEGEDYFEVWANYGDCSSGSVDQCTDGTEVGKCNSSGQLCSTKGAAPIRNLTKCYCNSSVLPGKCVTSENRLCKLNSDGTVGISSATCSAVIPSTKTCSIKTDYDAGIWDGTSNCLPWNLTGCTITCTSSEGSSETELFTKNKCLQVYPNLEARICVPGGEDYEGSTTNVDISELDLESIPDGKLKDFLKTNQTLRVYVKTLMDRVLNSLSGFVDSNDKCNFSGYNDAKDTASKYCSALDGKLTKGAKIPCSNARLFAECASCETDAIYHWSCENPITMTIPSLISKSYAQDNNTDGYTIYLPEFGMYSFELGDYTLTTDTTGGDKYYIFYVEANGKDGFQMPEDPDNPTSEEDIMLKSNGATITYEKVSSAQKYTIAKGINLVSFNFIPVSTELGALTADGVIKEAAKSNVTIKYISTFDGGRWSGSYSCQTDPCTGNDFTIVPGKGYLIYANNAGDITIPGYNLKSSIPVAFSSGWNLVGIHGYTTAYTARTLIDSINAIDGLTANNVSWWPTSKGKYEGLQVENSTEYGLDFAISPTNGYFVRISEFAPSDTTCKSILWNDGGTLNGTCGNTK